MATSGLSPFEGGAAEVFGVVQREAIGVLVVTAQACAGSDPEEVEIRDDSAAAPGYWSRRSSKVPAIVPKQRPNARPEISSTRRRL